MVQCMDDKLIDEWRTVDLSTVDLARRAHFQTRTMESDPLFRPLPFVRFDRGVAILDHSDDIAGVAWRYGVESAVYLEVSVAVDARRLGLGTRLLNSVLPSSGRALALCDAGQRSALRFMAQRGFEYESTIFAYRWDGDLYDVPPTFKNASVRPDPTPYQTWRNHRPELVNELPHTINMLRPEETDDLIGFEAWSGDVSIGSVVAIKGRQDLGVLSLWVDPGFRKQGIARLLICALLEAACERGVGLVVHLNADEDALKSHAKSLGFWTYRTWQCFSFSSSSSSENQFER
ncbi:MAG: GNAT family N-acetyltransferase [Bradymonadia bacterium]